MFPKLKAIFTTVTTGGVASAFFNIFEGRCTFAALVFSVVGCYGWLHGRDLTSYALFVGAIQALIVVHSYKEDVAERCRNTKK